MGVFTKKSKGAIATVACAGAACALNIDAIPESMKLTKVMKSFDWTKVPVAPIDFAVGIQELPEMTADEAIKRHLGPSGSIAFVVRRPG